MSEFIQGYFVGMFAYIVILIIVQYITDKKL